MNIKSLAGLFALAWTLPTSSATAFAQELPAAQPPVPFTAPPGVGSTNEQEFFGVRPVPLKPRPIACNSDRFGFDGQPIQLAAECRDAESACNCKVMENENYFEMAIPLRGSAMDKDILERIITVLARHTAAGFNTCEELFC